jgi:hypothetical protein
MEKVWTQERHIRIVRTWSMVWSPAERVRLTHRASGLVVKREVEPGQVERPLCLPPVKVLRLPEVLEVLMVSPDLDQMLRTFEEVSPLLEGSDDCQHLLVVDLVIVLDLT